MKHTEKQTKESNRDFAFRVIRENIVNLELKPGSMISEKEIADELHLSRTPVHEAMQELSSTKIIEILPQKGSLVSLINMTLVEEAVFVRVTIESAITEMACQKATEEEVQKLEENVTLQEFYYSKNNRDKIMELDNKFHKMMYEITDKMLSYHMVRTVNVHYDRIRKLHIHSFNPERIIKEHRMILEAFKSRNSEMARKAINTHLERHYTQEDEIRKKFPEYFEKK